MLRLTFYPVCYNFIEHFMFIEVQEVESSETVHTSTPSQ